MDWHGTVRVPPYHARVVGVRGVSSKESTSVPISKENLLSLIVLQQFFPKATELFFFTPAGDLATVTKLMTKAGSTLFCLPSSLNIVFIALTKEEAKNMEWEGVSLDRKWRMCMERERRKEEVVDLVARGLVNDLARHMSCLQEQLDQVKRQQLQLILNQIIDKPSTEVEPKGKSCSENAIEKKENSNTCNVEKGKEGPLQGSGGDTDNASIFLPSAQETAGSTRGSGCASVTDKKSKVIQKQGKAVNVLEVSDSEETDCALQGVVTIRPRIIKRQRGATAVNSSISQQK